MSDFILVAHGLTKTYGQICVLNKVMFSMHKGEIITIVGPSGSGKSTLLHLLGLLDTPNEGEIIVDGQKTRDITLSQKAALRSKYFGFVYQFHHLLQECTVLENIIMPQLILHGVYHASFRERALCLLSELRLSDRLDHFPWQLSGGERQRVAIARALSHGPQIVLADEPTGNLDPETALRTWEVFSKMAKERGTSIVMATHHEVLCAKADRNVAMTEICGHTLTNHL